MQKYSSPEQAKLNPNPNQTQTETERKRRKERNKQTKREKQNRPNGEEKRQSKCYVHTIKWKWIFKKVAPQFEKGKLE